MAINWSAYDAAKELYGDNKENIQDIGSRFPLFTRTVSMANDEYLLDILKAIPKVTARVVESGLKDMEDVEQAEPEEVPEKKEGTKKAEKKQETKPKKTKTKKEESETEEDSEDYESMTSKALYKLCCDRGISSQCKKRDKASLIAVLRANEGKSEPDDEDEWDDEEEEETDPYAGKSAKELYKMCCDRGIKTKPKQSADVYAKLLKKSDEEENEPDEDEDDDDEWEI